MEPFKEQILNFRKFEFATTLKVLRAYPEDKLEMKPAEKSRTARELAVAFIREEYVCRGAMRGDLSLADQPKNIPDSLHEMLEMLGHLVVIEDRDFDAATAVMGCAPAYLALAVEAIAAAGAEDGLDPQFSRDLVIETTAGTAELLRLRHPADVRAAVASEGGSTEAGLEALDAHGAQAAFAAAVQASLERMRGG